MITTYSQQEVDEAYEIGKRDGYDQAVQEIDMQTGGDGVYRACVGEADPDRHTPDAATMIRRIVDRFEILNLLDDATKTGRDQPDDPPSPETHVRGRFWFGTQPELLDQPALWMDDPSGGDPIIIATFKRIYKPELLSQLAAEGSN